MSAVVFVDTNVLVYSRDSSEPEKQSGAIAWMEHLWRTRGGRLSFQVLSEFYVTVTDKLEPGLDPGSARGDVRALFHWRPIPVDAAVIEVAWSIQERYRLAWWDALIVGAAQVADCNYLLTEDLQEGQRYGSVEVVNPFRKSADSLDL